jgi:hypothetical protein
MESSEHQKVHIEKAIERARDGVSDRIDELDRRLRSSLDFKAVASEHAPQLIAGGAVVGFLAGFGFPKPLRRIIQFGIPIALVAAKIRSSRSASKSAGKAGHEI